MVPLSFARVEEQITSAGGVRSCVSSSQSSVSLVISNLMSL